MDVRVGPLDKNAKGAPVAYLSDSQKKPITLTLGSKECPLRCPFGASSYNDDKAERLNLDFTCTEQIIKTISDIDSLVIDQLVANSPQYFKKKMTRADIEKIWRPTISPPSKEGYSATCRTKISTTGSKQVRCWDWETNTKVEKVEWRDAECLARVHVKGVYFMGSSCGLVIDTTDVLVRVQETASPFTALFNPFEG